jgi:radical SAM superfamily enzyme YgiQ (UPF0313 family)
MIYLINPPSDFLLEDRFVPNMGLKFLEATLRKHSFPVAIIEANTETDIPLDGDIYGISSTTPQFPFAVEFSRYIKGYTNATVVGGGAHVSTLPDESQRDALFDHVVIGEGEIKFLNLVSQLSGRGKVYSSPSSLDGFGLPVTDYAELETYGQYRKRSAVNFMTSRGCPFRCSFCSSQTVWGRTVRYHSLEYIENALRYYASLGFQAIRFMDDTLTLNNKRLRDIAALCVKYNLSWICQARVNQLNSDNVQMMIDHGCLEIAVGVESGDQQILDINNKKTTVEDNRRALTLCDQLGLPTKAYILLGLPGETEVSLSNTLHFMRTVPASKFTISVFCPYPGTDVWLNPSKYNVTIADVGWANYYGIGNSLVVKSIIKEMEPLHPIFEEIARSVITKTTYSANLSPKE